jgi:hypothetical protein
MGLVLWPKDKSASPRPLDIEIVYQNETKQQKKQQFVTDAEDLTRKINDLKDKANFLSKSTRRVREEQVARQTGRTQNGQPQSVQKNNIITSARNAYEKPSITGPGPTPKNNSNNGIPSPGFNASSIAEYIPEVKEGGFTSLNTDQYMYYTFYARINEQIRNRWVQNVRQVLQTLPISEMSRLSKKQQISQIEVILNSSGKFINAIIHQKAENRLLDISAATAFKDSAPFNNPPLEIVSKDDGLIHLHYQFYLQLQPRYTAGK